jgi:hypothetical protein
MPTSYVRCIQHRKNRKLLTCTESAGCKSAEVLKEAELIGKTESRAWSACEKKVSRYLGGAGSVTQGFPGEPTAKHSRSGYGPEVQAKVKPEWCVAAFATIMTVTSRGSRSGVEPESVKKRRSGTSPSTYLLEWTSQGSAAHGIAGIF